ncbi:MAG: hypothetical protein R2771_14620 [Saprospiraceae bacterium]
MEFPSLNDTIATITTEGIYHFVLYFGTCTDTAEIEITSDNTIPKLEYNVVGIDCGNQYGSITVTSTNSNISQYNWSYNNHDLGLNSNDF